MVISITEIHHIDISISLVTQAGENGKMTEFSRINVCVSNLKKYLACCLVCICPSFNFQGKCSPIIIAFCNYLLFSYLFNIR